MSRLIISHYHALYNHSNDQTVINEIRQKYWITSLRTSLRSLKAHCPACQLLRARPSNPRMADLPPGRLALNENLFTHCGMDYFGPLQVTIGKRKEKMWGVLFTCLTMRAVHLEIADSFTADFTIMAIQRMTARRGQPSVFYSDNGRNLRGAADELRQAYEALDQKRLQDFSVENGIKWVFVPQSAPHMGGAWESMVKAVKKVIYHALNAEAPREEVLRTLFAEAEHKVNSRRLTYVPLILSIKELLRLIIFCLGPRVESFYLEDTKCWKVLKKKLWIKSQRMADAFWTC